MIDQEEFVDEIRRAVDDLIEVTMDEDPEGDMPAVAFVSSGEKGMGVVPLEHLMVGELGKDFVGNVGLPMVLDMFGDIEAVALATTAWKSEKLSPEEHDEIRRKFGGQVSKYPNRTEAVFVSFGFTDGTIITAHREITRNQGFPPTLGEWEVMEGMPWQGRSGRMMDAVMAKLTGREVLSQAQIKAAAGVLAENDDLTEEMTQLLRERGFDIDAMAAPPSELTPEQREAFERAAMDLPQDFRDRLHAQLMEHMPEFGEAQFLEAVQRHQDEEDEKERERRDSVARDLRRWLGQ